ncbi:MAG: hypothetical protein H6Q72_2346 [Firmicutes bacterium]|nr:hypothetical protein [Bacillota bacterium]
MERKSSQSVEKLSRISPVLPIRFFKPLPDQSDLRKRKQKNPQFGKEDKPAVKQQEGVIDLKV